MTTHKDREIHITGGAQDTIRRCLDRVDSVRYWHGPAEGDRIAASLGKGLATLLLNAQRIMWDGDLSLISVWSNDFVVGLNFHRETPQQTERRLHPEDAEERLERYGDLIHQMPGSGEWSLNS